ncbi:unnamed protein product [Chondrus crispus]|uniref:Uncharacterized protein n=1 Tax=Chondrus crispus TaxID=2769 RepID=R7QMY3_CHOCR|nr:unnamed protein product [Chondrus crispus]CDF39867.1 unnamed protein product [Chondrus crispus]|eukprot:XP_005710161.1 unnamed protein product [Chondrus crispus]
MYVYIADLTNFKAHPNSELMYESYQATSDRNKCCYTKHFQDSAWSSRYAQHQSSSV